MTTPSARRQSVVVRSIEYSIDTALPLEPGFLPAGFLAGAFRVAVDLAALTGLPRSHVPAP